MTPKVRLEAEADRMLLTQQLLERVRPAQAKAARDMCCSECKQTAAAGAHILLQQSEGSVL